MRNKIKLMKNLLIIFLLLMSCAHAINWQEVYQSDKKVAYVDTDSVTEFGRYYFYNIKTLNTYTNKLVIITMQSKKSGGAAARINFYEPDEYESLNGDYSNITSKMTNKFEAVQFGSIAFSCFLKAKEILTKNNIQIEI